MFFLFSFATITQAAEVSCPASIKNDYECAQNMEQQLIKQFPALFSRSMGKLTIKLANGNKKVYIDNPVANFDAIHYSVVQFYKKTTHALIRDSYYEGYSHHLLDVETGEKFEILGTPVFSPSENRIAVYSFDIAAGFNPNMFAIYRFEQRKLIKEYAIEPNDWGVDGLRWLSNDAMMVDQTRFGEHIPNANGPHFTSEEKRVSLQTGKGKNERQWLMEK